MTERTMAKALGELLDSQTTHQIGALPVVYPILETLRLREVVNDLRYTRADIETHQRLQGVVTLTEELLAHRHDPRLARLDQGLRAALSPFASEYRDLQQGATWLRDIAHIPFGCRNRPVAVIKKLSHW